jgi:hypothetical protein
VRAEFYYRTNKSSSPSKASSTKHELSADLAEEQSSCCREVRFEDISPGLALANTAEVNYRGSTPFRASLEARGKFLAHRRMNDRLDEDAFE